MKEKELWTAVSAVIEKGTVGESLLEKVRSEKKS